MTRIVIPPLAIHPGQQSILASDARYRVISAGRRFGKTLLAIEWLALMPGGAIDGAPVGFFAPTYKLLLDVWSDMERTLKPVTRKANKTEMRLELITGGKIDFWTLEDPDAGRGRKYRRVVLDEAAHARNLQVAWERAIAPTLTDYSGEAWFISTPNGLNYFHTLHRRGADPEFSDWASFHMPTRVNPHIAPDEIDRARADLPELVFAQEYLAEFITFGAGLVKPDMLIDGVAPPGLPVVLGVDLAISEKQGADFTAIVAMSRDPRTGLVYVMEAERHRVGFAEVLERIKAAAARWRPVMVAIEQTQYQAAVVQELTRTTALPVRGVRPDRDKLTRFMPLLTRYEQHQVRHDPARVPAWFRDELLSFPTGQHDDGCFVAGTLVLTPSGGVPIESIKTGDAVLTRGGPRTVIAAGMTAPLADIYRIEAEHGFILEGTHNHPVMTNSGWVKLGELRDCDSIIVCYGVKTTGNDQCHNHPRSSITAESGFTEPKAGTLIGQALRIETQASKLFTNKFGSMQVTRFQSIIAWCMSTATRTTTGWKTWRSKGLSAISSLGSAFTGGPVNPLCITALRSTATLNLSTQLTVDTFHRELPIDSAELIYFTGKSGKMPTVLFRRAITFITKIATQGITPWKTLKWSLPKIIRKSTTLSIKSKAGQRSISTTLTTSGQRQPHGTAQKKVLPGTQSTESGVGIIANCASLCAQFAKKILKPGILARSYIARITATKRASEKPGSIKITAKPAGIAEKTSWASKRPCSVPTRVHRVTALRQKRPVFNLTVDGDHEYFANGALVHNCDAAAYAFAAIGAPSGIAGHITRVVN